MNTNGDITGHNEPLFEQLSYTPYSPCNYLQNQVMRFAGFTAADQWDDERVQRCIQTGYRRSGLFVYKTSCLNCTRCIPVRIDVNRFKPNRTQKRIFKRNAALFSAHLAELKYKESHYDLYDRYLQKRHKNSEMALHNNRLQYQQFILQSPIHSYLFEFFHQAKIDIVCLMDSLDDGLSAVYTFYNPVMEKQSLGIFAILWQIELVKQLEKDYLYLGYYIADYKPMAYKRQFSGLEAYIDDQWVGSDLFD